MKSLYICKKKVTAEEILFYAKQFLNMLRQSENIKIAMLSDNDIFTDFASDILNSYHPEPDKDLLSAAELISAKYLTPMFLYYKECQMLAVIDPGWAEPLLLQDDWYFCSFNKQQNNNTAVQLLLKYNNAVTETALWKPVMDAGCENSTYKTLCSRRGISEKECQTETLYRQLQIDNAAEGRPCIAEIFAMSALPSPADKMLLYYEFLPEEAFEKLRVKNKNSNIWSGHKENIYFEASDAAEIIRLACNSAVKKESDSENISVRSVCRPFTFINILCSRISPVNSTVTVSVTVEYTGQELYEDEREAVRELCSEEKIPVKFSGSKETSCSSYDTAPLAHIINKALFLPRNVLEQK